MREQYIEKWSKIIFKNAKEIIVLILLSIVLSSCAKVHKNEASDISKLNYSSPVELISGKNNRHIYIAEKTANSIAVFDIDACKILKKIKLPLSPSGLALAKNGRDLYVTGSAPEGQVFIIDLNNYKVKHHITVGHSPNAPVVSPDGKTLYVSNRFDNTISVINLRLKRVVKTIRVLREPVAASITPDGKYLFIANYLPIGPMDRDYRAIFITVIDAENNKAIKNIQMIYGTICVQDLCVSPDGKFIYATHTIANYKNPTSFIEKGNINKSSLTIINVENLSRENTVLLDDIDLGAANPWGIECSEDGKYLCIAHSGTHEISVIDRKILHEKLSTNENRRNQIPDDFTFLSDIRHRYKIQGNGPRGLSIIGNKIFIAEYFSNSLGILDFSAFGKPQTQSFTLGKQKELTTVRRGEILFHDASICFQQWQSCASCHPGEGRSDALNWDLLNDGTGNTKNTKSLLLSHRTPPSMITGIRDRAEVAVLAGFKFIEFTEISEEDASAVDDYLKSLKPIPSPYLKKNKLTRAAKRGKKLFKTAGCSKCHPEPLYTDMKKYDVGTCTDEEMDCMFDTPTLVEMWRTHPYLFNGSAATINQVLTTHNLLDKHGTTSTLSKKQINDLAEYILSL